VIQRFGTPDVSGDLVVVQNFVEDVRAKVER
jgi:hypothetical protein